MRRFLVIGFTACCLASAGIALADQQEEYAALMKILNDPALETRIQLGEEFLQKYPKSTYVANVHQKLVSDYTASAAAFGEKNNDAKSLEMAQKALQGVNSGERPDNVPEKDWATQKNTLLEVNQFLIGTAYLHLAQKKSAGEKSDLLAKARQSLMAALKLNSRNDRVYYQLGLTLSEMGEGADACDALAKAVVLNGPVKAVAQYDLERIYVHYNKSKVGLEKVLAKAKAAK